MPAAATDLCHLPLPSPSERCLILRRYWIDADDRRHLGALLDRIEPVHSSGETMPVHEVCALACVSPDQYDSLLDSLYTQAGMAARYTPRVDSREVSARYYAAQAGSL